MLKLFIVSSIRVVQISAIRDDVKDLRSDMREIRADIKLLTGNV